MAIGISPGKWVKLAPDAANITEFFYIFLIYFIIIYDMYRRWQLVLVRANG